jgi:feruloyl-CoA synthase
MSHLKDVGSGASVPLRDAEFFSSDIIESISNDGYRVIRSAEILLPHSARVGDWLAHWARTVPHRVFLNEPIADGERSITYGEAGSIVSELCTGLIEFTLGPERPLLIVADNGIDHALMMLAALRIGAPVSSIAPAYALQTADLTKLKGVFSLLTPGLVVVEDAITYSRVIDEVVRSGIRCVALRNAGVRPGVLSPADLRRQDSNAAAAVATAARRVSADSIAQFMFTSGSTGTPKAVILTHGNLCANGQMTVQAHPFLLHEPPVMVDWLPWNHVAGGNSLRLVLYTGGTLYIDRGRPTEQLIGRSVELLRRVSPTIYFNVPAGFEALLPYLENDSVLRKSLFERVKFLWYAAAPMRQSTWDALERVAVEACGERVLIVSGFGMTETSPLAIFGNHRAAGVGVVGVPVPGCEAKLVPHDDKLELLLRGPNITPGYWRNETATQQAFTDDGFFRTGDLVSFVDPMHPAGGMRFEGRIAEDFKLASGTRVNAGPLRLRALEAFRPLASDIVVAGEGRNDIRLLLFPNWAACYAALKMEPVLPAEGIKVPALRELFGARLKQLTSEGTGSATRIVGAALVGRPPVAAMGEVTEKGTINARMLLRIRALLVDQLYGELAEDKILIA